MEDVFVAVIRKDSPDDFFVYLTLQGKSPLFSCKSSSINVNVHDIVKFSLYLSITFQNHHTTENFLAFRVRVDNKSSVIHHWNHLLKPY